ncbi:MAG: acylneuraminate cytidylyltransferase [Spirochaetaceae bacterium]|nr:MAG: acylneuraminate cytidylyltransferase [Spirochaetaceae bacterium]
MGGRAVICVFLQARLDSTRLPRKALLELAGRTVLEHAMEAMRLVPAQRYVLLTDAAGAECFRGIARTCGFDLFAGSPDDVLDRYCSAIHAYEPTTVIRATGDNPLVSPELARKAVVYHRATGADYTGLLGMPIGLGVEVLRASALIAAGVEAQDAYEREHVSPFLYRRPERFRIVRPRVERLYDCEYESVTLDTADDYARLVRIFENLYDGKPIDTPAVVEWLRRHGSDVAGYA